MANTLDGLFETLVAATGTGLMLMPELANNFLDNVFNGFVPGTTGKVGKNTVINIPVVNRANVTNIGNGPVVNRDAITTPVEITIDQKLSTSRTIQDFDAALTPLDLQALYLKPMVEEVMQAANFYLAELMFTGFTTAIAANGSAPAFTPNPTIHGPASANPAFSRLNLSQAWKTLINQGCPGANLKCMIDPTPYANMVGDDTNKFISQFIVGTEAATSAQQSARLMPAFGAILDWDQHATTLGTAGTYGGLFYHKLSVGLSPIVESSIQGGVSKRMVIYPTKGKTMPFTVQMWEDPNGQGVKIHVYTCFGAKVVKPGWGVYLETLPAVTGP